MHGDHTIYRTHWNARRQVHPLRTSYAFIDDLADIHSPTLFAIAVGAARQHTAPMKRKAHRPLHNKLHTPARVCST